jgi:hypothetical protein
MDKTEPVFATDTTIVIITYNSTAYIRDCLHSVERAVASDTPILVIDNHSTDDTAHIVQTEFPTCRLIALPQNIGHSAACNLALQLATTTWILLLDHDTTVPQGWLEPLLNVAATFWPDTATVSSRAIFDHRAQLHHDGGFAHYVGHMTLHHGFAPLDQHRDDLTVQEVGAQASTSLLVHRTRALAVGGLDARFFIYLNDFEFSLRLRLRGWRCYVTPRSIVYHRQGNPQTSWRGSGVYPLRRAFLIYRNRWMLIIKLYARRTLLVCAPMLLLYEGILLAAALRKGWLTAYVQALRDVWRHWPALMFQRHTLQQHRCISDKDLLSAHGFSFVPGLVEKPLARLGQRSLEQVIAAYWWLVQPLL